MFKILVGEETLRHTTSNIFASYEVDFISSYDEFIDASYEKEYDLYILNLYYYSALEELQKSDDKTDVIFIDEFYNINNLKKALRIGDNYMVKPLYLEELEIRIKYHYRKTFNCINNIITYNDFYFHLNSKQLFLKSQKIKLSPNELKLIKLFFTHINKPISKEIIFDTLENTSDGSLRVYISKLNKLSLHVEYDRAISSYTLKSS